MPWLLLPALAAAQPVPRDAAPLAWRRYAQDVEALVVAALAAAADIADPLPDAAGLRVRLWIDADGSFSRIEAPAAPDFAAMLAKLLAERRAPPPPSGMTWPMTLLLRGESSDNG